MEDMISGGGGGDDEDRGGSGQSSLPSRTWMVLSPAS